MGLITLATALLTEILTGEKDYKHGRRNDLRSEFCNNHPITLSFIIRYILIFFVLYMAIFIVDLLLIRFVFHIIPQGENIWILLKRIAQFYGWNILIPIFISIVASAGLQVVRKKQLLLLVISIIIVLSICVSGLGFFVEAFRVVQRPTLPLPVEAVSFIINSRLRAYPFEFSGNKLCEIGDGSYLFEKDENDNLPAPDSINSTSQPVYYEEPNSLSEYINAIFEGTYAEGMSWIDYLRKAYEYYQTGRYTNYDWFHIGIMWTWIYDNFHYFVDIEVPPSECLDKSLEAYQKYEQYFGESAALYSNIAGVYYSKDDRNEARRYILLALGISPSGSNALSNYKKWVYNWVDSETYELLMEDARTILDCEKNLSMYILYGACAVAGNKNIPQAYEFLCTADSYYNGKSAMVKILRCICADLLGQNESQVLSEIYNLEQIGKLTSEEEIYLIRYLFVTNRYEELWGYIVQAGEDPLQDKETQAELIAMKTIWYLKNQSSVYFNSDNVEQLLTRVEKCLGELSDESEERDLLLLSRTLLQSCLNLTDTTEPGTDIPEGLSDLEYALLSIKLFNAGKYPEAIQVCELFFQLDREESMPSDIGINSLGQMEPQEQTSLRYYVQLVFAYSNFEYSKTFPMNSELRTAYMTVAERECEAFEQSSKSLFYIGEQFRMLRTSIEEAQGKVPEEVSA